MNSRFSVIDDTQEIWPILKHFGSPQLHSYATLSNPNLIFDDKSWAVYSTLRPNNLYSIFYPLCISGDLNVHIKSGEGAMN